MALLYSSLKIESYAKGTRYAKEPKAAKWNSALNNGIIFTCVFIKYLEVKTTKDKEKS